MTADRAWKKWLVWPVLLLVALGGYALWNARSDGERGPSYRTETVDRGDVTLSVSANGTINPVTVVTLGTQVSGTVLKLNADFNDHVTKGQVVAELDPSLLRAALRQSKANLASARASAKLAETNEKRIRDLFAKDYVARADLDQAEQQLETARAQVEVAAAQVARDSTNLANTVIRSPVSGVVISRNVDVGQTVAASFQTPTLFQIATDLTKMQIDSSVAEADVGGIRVGQHADFTVDAFPGRQFTGTVHQIRLNPTVQQNVVTYNVVLSVDNPDKILLPGMTAYVNILLDQRRNVPRVSNTALSFRPRTDGSPVARSGESPGPAVYVVDQNQARRVPLQLGLRGDRYTEITGGGLKAGDRVVLEQLNAGAGTSGGSSGSFRIRMF